jgi:hypothetical protein
VVCPAWFRSGRCGDRSARFSVHLLGGVVVSGLLAVLALVLSLVATVVLVLAECCA